MKKSTYFAFITVILIVLILQAFGSRIKVYEKTKKYTSQEEVIANYLENVNLAWTKRNNKGIIIKYVPNLEFYETISKRYRLSEESGQFYKSIPYFDEYKIENVSSFDNIFAVNALNYHLDSYKRIKNYKIPENREIYKISGKAINNIQFVLGDGTVNEQINNYVKDNNNYSYMEIYLVVVDEGEGFVVDDCLERFSQMDNIYD